MIHNNSSDPVLIKKIHLQIWTLRSEIENIIENSLSTNPEEVKKTIAALRNEFSGVTAGEEEPLPDNVLGMPGAEPEGDEETEGEELAAEAQDLESDPENPENPDENPDVEQDQEETPEELEASTELPVEEAQVIDDQTPLDDTEASDADNTHNISAYIPDSTEAGEAVFQRRPDLSVNEKIRAMCFLSEINMDAFYFFCDKDMTSGQSIVIDFLVPQRFLVMAEVVFCRPYNMRSRIISQTPLLFRCAAKPLFIKAGERTLLREFLETIEPDAEALAAQQKAKKPIKKKDEEEDLDDLDDLDL